MIKNKWSYIYAYNLKTLRDIFVYCALKGQIEEKRLYGDMSKNLIPPPKTQWINEKVERKERLRLEYVHAAEYLGFIKREKGVITPDFDKFGMEKRAIIKANKGRIFKPSPDSVDLKETEKCALINIIFDYERARDYLYWFLDFEKYRNSGSFKLIDFKRNGKPIFLSGKTLINKRGTDVIKRCIDNKLWRIPEAYIRLVNSLFPIWFIELGLINKVSIFPEFSEDKQLWHMFYPIRISDEDFLNKNVGKLLEELFLKDANRKSVWLPFLIYTVVSKYACTTMAVKKALEKLYKEDYEHYYLERTSLSLMRGHLRYKDSYIKVDGFFRSSLILIRRFN